MSLYPSLSRIARYFITAPSQVYGEMIVQRVPPPERSDQCVSGPAMIYNICL